jgi:hypothetical protein
VKGDSPGVCELHPVWKHFLVSNRFVPAAFKAGEPPLDAGRATHRRQKDSSLLVYFCILQEEQTLSGAFLDASKLLEQRLPSRQRPFWLIPHGVDILPSIGTSSHFFSWWVQRGRLSVLAL